MKTQVVIPAAGAGTRLKSSRPKALVLLNGKPIVSYSLRVFEKCSLIHSIVIAAGKKYLSEFEKIVKKYRLTKVKKIVAGGKTRRESVSNGLKALDADTDFVLIHDAARPFVTKEIITKALSVAKREKTAVVAVPVKPTVKSVFSNSCVVQKTLDRDNLWEIQTPQIFKKDIILKAHKKIKTKNPSDDALLVEKTGVKVRLVMGDYKNIKITTKDDLIFARAILASRKI